jgi:hypothetical protein
MFRAEGSIIKHLPHIDRYRTLFLFILKNVRNLPLFIFKDTKKA